MTVYVRKHELYLIFKVCDKNLILNYGNVLKIYVYQSVFYYLIVWNEQLRTKNDVCIRAPPTDLNSKKSDRRKGHGRQTAKKKKR